MTKEIIEAKYKKDTENAEKYIEMLAAQIGAVVDSKEKLALAMELVLPITREKAGAVIECILNAETDNMLAWRDILLIQGVDYKNIGVGFYGSDGKMRSNVDILKDVKAAVLTMAGFDG